MTDQLKRLSRSELPMHSKDPLSQDVASVQDELAAAIETGQGSPPLHSPTDATEVVRPAVVPPRIQHVLNVKDRLANMVESVDLIEQIYFDYSKSQPSSAPFHGHQVLQIVPYWFNRGKGSGFEVSFELTVTSIIVNQTNPTFPTQAHEMASLLLRTQDIHQAYSHESRVPVGQGGWVSSFSNMQKSDIIREAT